MTHPLDTSICVFVIRRKLPTVIQRLQRFQDGDLGISTVTLAELRYGADKSSNPARNHNALDAFLLPLQIIEFTAQAAEFYGRVRADLEYRGLPIGPLDTMIASHALSLGVPIVTNNVAEFSRVTGLHVEDWSAP